MDFGNLKLYFLGHSGFIIENKFGKRIAIDPFNISDGIDKVDVILITHTHQDHCSIKDIRKLAKSGTIVAVPADAQSKITKILDVDMHVLEVGEVMSYGGMKIEVMPAYTIGKIFHSKKEGWFGYIIKSENVVIYHAGDSTFIPEMEKLTGYGKKENIFVALLPVSGDYLMDADDAAQTAALLKPDYAIPMHYGSGVAGSLEDAKDFVEICQTYNIHSLILEKI